MSSGGIASLFLLMASSAIDKSAASFAASVCTQTNWKKRTTPALLFDIPNEKAPDNVAQVRFRCDCPDDVPACTFSECSMQAGATTMVVEAGTHGKAFAGKSGNMHSLVCSTKDKPIIGETFAAGMCKAPGKSWKTGSETIKFNCADKDTVASCIPEGQTKEFSASSSAVGLFGGKTGNLFAIRCFAHDEPEFTMNYARGRRGGLFEMLVGI